MSLADPTLAKRSKTHRQRQKAKLSAMREALERAEEALFRLDRVSRDSLNSAAFRSGIQLCLVEFAKALGDVK